MMTSLIGFSSSDAMHCLIVLLLAITGSLAAIRCFQGQETFPAGQGTPYVAGGLLPSVFSVNCPTAEYCFNSIVKRGHNSDNSYTITKSCGEIGKCFVSSLSFLAWGIGRDKMC
ncbi:unnamed protein product [Heligmosomoides polygyrus]|uniref:Secreted protein n=1 Tax=Heligmosomoides polygyrus TaxID=6339 RepID=A0A183GHI3_HELPZ|nr:unnamed protein product [Heligmosomoides polygyrus]